MTVTSKTKKLFSAERVFRNSIERNEAKAPQGVGSGGERVAWFLGLGLLGLLGAVTSETKKRFRVESVI